MSNISHSIKDLGLPAATSATTLAASNSETGHICSQTTTESPSSSPLSGNWNWNSDGISIIIILLHSIHPIIHHPSQLPTHHYHIHLLCHTTLISNRLPSAYRAPFSRASSTSCSSDQCSSSPASIEPFFINLLNGRIKVCTRCKGTHMKYSQNGLLPPPYDICIGH